MELTKLVNSIRVIQLAGEVERKDIESITYDSRKVKSNTLFVAIKGFNTDGHRYILDAINKGATAVILEDNNAVPEEIFRHRNVTKMLVRDSRQALSEVSNAFFKQSSAKLRLIGITGTKGKTTTSFFIKKILEVSGNKTGLIGTIANYIGEEPIYTTMTTPESSDLNQLFSEMVSKGCSRAVMEVSSHSLALKRVANLTFSAAVFTNITSDHLDFHNTFEEYFEAKKILFDSLNEDAVIVYNIEDPNSEAIIADSKAAKYSVGVRPESDFRLADISYDLEGTRFTLHYRGTAYQVKTRLIGEFNAFNAASAIAVCMLTGTDINTAIKAVEETPQVPGRFETIHHGDKKVIIDYSHTADSLQKALEAIKSITRGERPVYTVFGCGGNRDRTKRPVMGKIAATMSSHVIVTSDNPRNEDPMDIINEITSGIESDNYLVIESREEAIKTAVQESENNAVVLIAGKGHENYQEIKGQRSHFSDRETAERYLQK